MNFVVYIIKRLNKGETSYYTGFTNDMQRRFKEHQKSGCNKGYDLCGYLIIAKTHSRSIAMRIEKMIKKLSKENKAKYYYYEA